MALNWVRMRGWPAMCLKQSTFVVDPWLVRAVSAPGGVGCEPGRAAGSGPPGLQKRVGAARAWADGRRESSAQPIQSVGQFELGQPGSSVVRQGASSSRGEGAAG